MAYQIAFDMYESATQQFLGRVLLELRGAAPIPQTAHVVVKVPVENPTPSPSPSPAPVVEDTGPVRDMDSLVSLMLLLLYLNLN